VEDDRWYNLFLAIKTGYLDEETTRAAVPNLLLSPVPLD
jgi:hypothetical protein